MSETYALTGDSSVVVRGDGVNIPADPGNADWQRYQAWLAGGNQPTSYVEPLPGPSSCQLWQLQAVMSPAQWAQVVSAVATLNDPAVSAFMAHGTNVIPADSKTLLALAATLGLDSDAVTALVGRAAAVKIA